MFTSARAKTHRRNRCIDRSVSRSDNNNALWRRGYRAQLITGNQIESVRHSLKFFARDTKLMDRSQANT